MKLFSFLLASLILVSGSLHAAPLTEDDFTVVSSPASPRVAYAISKSAAGLDLVIGVEPLGAVAEGIKVSVGASAGQKVLLTEKQARISRENGEVRFAFQVPTNALSANAADWAKLRLAFAVAWPGGVPGETVCGDGFTSVRAPADARLPGSDACPRRVSSSDSASTRTAS